MTTRSFFSWMLLLPYIFGAAGLLLPSARILAMALLFRGIPYVVFGLGLFFLIRRAPDRSRLVRLSLAAPVFFVPCVAIFVAVVGSSPATSDLALADVLTQLAPVAVYALAFGYLYVGLAWALWAVARGLGVVSDAATT